MEDKVVNYIKAIVIGLIDNPDEFYIERTDDELGALFTITVSKDDIGNLLGKNADTINAIRRIIRVYGYRQDLKISLKVNGDRT